MLVILHILSHLIFTTIELGIIMCQPFFFCTNKESEVREVKYVDQGYMAVVTVPYCQTCAA